MSAYIDTTVKAVLYGGAVATNYQSGCFADDVTYKAELTTDNPLGWDNRSGEFKKRLIFFSNDAAVTNNNGAKNGIGEFKIEQSKFANGIADNIRVNFNFGRSVKDAENPFKLNPAVDFNISGLKDGSANGSAVISGSNITFFYGRAFSKNYEEESPIAAQMRYEIYCTASCGISDYGISLTSVNFNDSRWFLNMQHNSSADGDILFFKAAGKTSIIDKMPPKNGISTLNLINNAGFTPYHDIIYAAPEKWLIYNSNNEYATDTSFDVDFIGAPSVEWAGKGGVNSTNDPKAATGQVIDIMPSRKTSNKMSW
jgi:hypothetical protein